MKINRVEIDAFGALGEATISLEDKGLVLIQGENKDDTSQNSNGAGKSTVVEALSWCLFAETARGDTGDAIVNNTLGKGTRVLVQLVDDDRTYNVIRHRKHKEHKNRVLLFDVTNPDDVVELTGGTDKLTQDKVNKIVGCSPDVFRAAIYYGQESQIDLPALTDKNLKAIVEEAAGIDKMQAAHAIARGIHSEALGAETAAAHALDKVNELLKASQERLEELKAQVETHKTDTEAKAKAKLLSVAETVKQAKARKAKADAMKPSELESEREAIGVKISAVDSERDKQVELKGAVSAASRNVEASEKATLKAKNTAMKGKTLMASVNDEVGTECDSCGHTIEESDIAGRIAAIKRDTLEAVAETKKLASETESLKEALSEASEALRSFESSMTDTSELVSAQRAIDEQLKQHSALIREVTALTERAKADKAEADRLKAAANPYVSLVEKEGEAIESRVSEKAASELKLNAAREEVEISKQVVAVFAPSGLRAHILDTVTPFLNDRTARYLGVLSDGNISATWTTLTKTAKGELREKFGIEVTSRTGGKAYRSLSGGEKRKVRLATALALQDLVSSRATKPIQLWLGDEIDDAVDIAGLERLMTVLEEKAKEKGTVLIISHNELSDWCRQHANVVKEGGKAHMTGVLNIDREKLGV